MQLAIVAMISKATLSHVTAIFREERRYFVLGRELASIGFGYAAFNVPHLPRLPLQILPQSFDRQKKLFVRPVAFVSASSSVAIANGGRTLSGFSVSAAGMGSWTRFTQGVLRIQPTYYEGQIK